MDPKHGSKTLYPTVEFSYIDSYGLKIDYTNTTESGIHIKYMHGHIKYHKNNQV